MNERQQVAAWIETALRYLDALDAGDVDTLAAMWERAEMDPKWEQILGELTGGIAVENEWESDAESVRGLLREHLPSAFPSVVEPPPLTVGDVAKRLGDSALGTRMSEADRTVNERLLANTAPVPDELGLPHFEKWRVALGIEASNHYWRAFRQAAVLLAMGRCQKVGELAAARRAPKGGRP